MNYEYQNQVLGMVIYRPERYWPEVKNKWNPEVFGDVDRIKLATVIQELLNSDVEFNHAILKDKLNGHSATMLIPILGNYIPETNITFFMDQLLMIWRL